MKVQTSLLPNVVLCFVLMTLTIHQTNGKIVEITRAERDIFTNVGGCNEANARCVNTHCTYCRCTVSKTFVQTRGQHGECVANDLLIYATSYDASFLLQNNAHKVCIYQKLVRDTFLLGGASCKTDDLDYRWLWTKHGQLLHFGTLQCATDDYYGRLSRTFFPTMNICDRNDQRQLWNCEGDKKYDIIQTETGRYMHYGKYWRYVTTGSGKSHLTKWNIYNTEKDVCSQAVGCDVYVDGTSLLILNRTKCKERSECLGQKEISLSQTSCVLSPSKTQYLHNDTWKPLEIKNGSFGLSSSENKVYLKWNLNETPRSWGGLLVKVQFKCEDMTQTIKTEHCVVIKYMGTFTGFHDDDDDGDGDDVDDDDDDDGDDDDNGDGNQDKDKSNINTEEKSKDNTKIIIIIVCVLVILLLSGVVIFMIFRRRNRLSRSRKRNTVKQDKKRKQSEEQNAESMNPVYPTNNDLKSAERECELYETTPHHVYQYLVMKPKTAGAPTQNSTYDYAFPNMPVKIGQQIGQKDTPEDTNSDEAHQLDRQQQNEETKDTNAKPPQHYYVLEKP